MYLIYCIYIYFILFYIMYNIHIVKLFRAHCGFYDIENKLLLLLLCSTRGWASENNCLTLHRKFKAVYSERPHNVAFRACDEPSTAPTWSISGVHIKLRNKITMHVCIVSVHVFVAWWGWGPLGHARWGPLGRYSTRQCQGLCLAANLRWDINVKFIK